MSINAFPRGNGIPASDSSVVHIAGAETITGAKTFSDATSPIITAKLGPTSGQQHALPAVASDTLALLGIAQSWAGLQTFSNGIAIATTKAVTGAAELSLVATGSNPMTATVNGVQGWKVWPNGTVSLGGNDQSLGSGGYIVVGAMNSSDAGIYIQYQGSPYVAFATDSTAFRFGNSSFDTQYRSFYGMLDMAGGLCRLQSRAGVAVTIAPGGPTDTFKAYSDGSFSFGTQNSPVALGTDGYISMQNDSAILGRIFGTIYNLIGMFSGSTRVGNPTFHTSIRGIYIEQLGGLCQKATTVADTDTTFGLSDYETVYTSLTAARVVTLQAPGSFLGSYPDQPRYVRVTDDSGSCSVTNTITVTVSGGSAIVGNPTDIVSDDVVLNTPYASVLLKCNGTVYQVVEIYR